MQRQENAISMANGNLFRIIPRATKILKLLLYGERMIYNARLRRCEVTYLSL